MKTKYPFFHLQDDNNLIRFITRPYKFYSHIHNSKREICFSDFESRCLTCLIEGMKFFPREECQRMVGLFSIVENKKFILRMDESLYQEVRRKTQSNYDKDMRGDPTSFDLNLKLKTRRHEDGRLINKLYNITMLKKHNASMYDKKLGEECLRLSNPMKQILSSLSSVKEFKDFCLLCRNVEDESIFDNLVDMVNNEYAQYSNALKTILLFG